MTTDIVKKLRQAIDAKHANALEALKELETYLEGQVSTAGNKSPAAAKKPKSKSKPPSRAGTGKIRPAVLAALASDFVSIKVVAEQTGFSSLQVRGVVMAPGLKERFAKKEINGVMHYKYESKDSQ